MDKRELKQQMIFSDFYYRANKRSEIDKDIQHLLTCEKYSNFTKMSQLGKGGEGSIFAV